MIIEKLLFVVHKGTVAREPAGIIMEGTCLPIACSHSSWEGHGVPVAEDGFYSLWEATADIEAFFDALGIHHVRQVSEEEPNGLWVYEVTYQDDILSDYEHLVATPEVSCGAACIEGTGVPTWTIHDRYLAGETVPKLSEDFQIKQSLIEEAIQYEDRVQNSDWLKDGHIRRPTLEELEPLTRGKAPWGGVVL